MRFEEDARSGAVPTAKSQSRLQVLPDKRKPDDDSCYGALIAIRVEVPVANPNCGSRPNKLEALRTHQTTLVKVLLLRRRKCLGTLEA